MDDYYSTPKLMNSGVPQRSALLPIFVFSFINDLLSSTESNIFVYAHGSTPHYSTLVKRRPTQEEAHHSRMDVVRCLTSNLAIIFELG